MWHSVPGLTLIDWSGHDAGRNLNIMQYLGAADSGVESGGRLKTVFLSVWLATGMAQLTLSALLVCSYLTARHSSGLRCGGVVDFQVSQSTPCQRSKMSLAFHVVNQSASV